MGIVSDDEREPFLIEVIPAVDLEAHSHHPFEFFGIQWAVVGDEDANLQVVLLLRLDNEGFRRFHFVESSRISPDWEGR